MDILLKVGKSIKTKAHYYCLALFLTLLGPICFAETIVIPKNTVIKEDKTYSNVTLDMRNGSFLVKNNATLTINKCVINGTLSESNPVLFDISKGNLALSENQVSITTSGLNAHPKTQSLQNAIQVAMGSANLAGNSFKIDKSFTAGLLITTASIPTTGFKITKNTFENFHGVLYLIASDNALISDNRFLKNSYGHIVTIGNNIRILRNIISFPGNDRLGNAIDVIDSDRVTVSRNILLTPTCHGIYVLNSHGLTIDSNRIYGGITYAMSILTFPEVSPPNPYLTEILASHQMKNSLSSQIRITNNFMSQNRFGIAASDVRDITVNNNIFIQRFADKATRQFWTNNKVLFTNVTQVTWTNNLYKEAFTQEASGDNSQSFSFVPFPATGGVVL